VGRAVKRYRAFLGYRGRRRMKRKRKKEKKEESRAWKFRRCFASRGLREKKKGNIGGEPSPTSGPTIERPWKKKRKRSSRMGEVILLLHDLH